MTRKIIPFILIFTIIFSSFGLNTYSANSGQAFTDVNENHWASKFITKMKVREVVAGYVDQTFKPNEGIDQAQAVSMVIRFLGYEDEASSLRDTEVSEENELYSYVQDAQGWAKGYILVAARLGLISKASSAGFSPSEEASRAWMAKLLVTAIQKHGSISSSPLGLSFKDSEQIPVWAREEVNIATNLNIITGYTDGTFKPDRAVTRAEMTALLSKAEEFIDSSYLHNVIRGKIEIKQSDSLIINMGNNKLEKVFIGNESAILYQGNNRISFSQLRSTDEISVVVNDNDEVIYLELLNTSERKSNEIQGKIYLNDISRELLTIEDDSKALLSYKITKDTIVVKNNSTIKISDLNVHDLVRITVEENEITIIEIIEAYENQSEAEIVSINAKERIITAKVKDDKFEVISFKNQISIYDQQGGTVAFDQLKVGDKIILIYQDEKVSSIEIPLSFLYDYEATNFRSGRITLSKNGVSQEYEYAKDLKIVISGLTGASITDVEVGDRVKATLFEDKIIELELLNRERKTYVLDNVDTSARALRVRDIKSNSISYISYESTANLYRDYRLLDSFSELRTNDRIVLNLKDNRALRIDIAVQQNYTITEINQNNNTLRLKDTNNRTSAFTYTDQSIIRVNNTQSQISNFSVNDSVSVYKIGNEIIEISK